MPDGELNPGRHDACKRAVGPPRDHRTPGSCTRLSRYSPRRVREDNPPARTVLLQCCRRRLDRVCQRHWRHVGDVRLRDRVGVASRPTPTPPWAATASSRSRAMVRASGEPLKFEIKASPPAPPIERQNIPTELKFEAPSLL